MDLRNVLAYKHLYHLVFGFEVNTLILNTLSKHNKLTSFINKLILIRSKWVGLLKARHTTIRR